MSFLGYAAVLLCWMHCAAQREKLCDNPRIENGKLSASHENYFPKTFGQTVNYRCLDGYSTPTGKFWVRITCTERGWSPEPKCLKQCSVRELTNGNIPRRSSEEFYKEGETVRYECHNGYQPEHEAVTCTRDGWAPTPRCIREMFYCAREIPNARIASTLQERYLPGARVHYQCDSNFEMMGRNYIVCSNGQWSQAPVCRDMTCEPPPEIAGGRIDGIKKPRYFPGESAKYQCWENFKMTGAPTVVCHNGTWTELPTCRGEGGRCGRPTAIQDGDFLGLAKKEYEEGDTLEYKCQNLYILEGTQTITCINGQWTNPPVCRVPCRVSEEDMDINNIKVKSDPTKPELYIVSGDSIEFECKPGYLKDPCSPNFRVQCVEGTLDYPRCTRGRSCVLDRNTMASNNIQLEPSSPASPSYQSGDHVNFECKPRHRLVSHTGNRLEAQCLDGEITYPVCLVFCTTSEEDMDRNNIQLKWTTRTKLYSTLGDIIEFKCKPGYLKDPSSPNFRIQCVEGTLDYPRCTRGRSCVLDRNTMASNNIQLEPSSPASPSYQSGDHVNFECKPRHRLVSRTTNRLEAQCLDGEITYPVCEWSWWG